MTKGCALSDNNNDLDYTHHPLPFPISLYHALLSLPLPTPPPPTDSIIAEWDNKHDFKLIPVRFANSRLMTILHSRTTPPTPPRSLPEPLLTQPIRLRQLSRERMVSRHFSAVYLWIPAVFCSNYRLLITRFIHQHSSELGLFKMN